VSRFESVSSLEISTPVPIMLVMPAKTSAKRRLPKPKIFHFGDLEYKWYPPGYRGGSIPTSELKKAVRAALSERNSAPKKA